MTRLGDLLEGTPYRLLERIGSGGMGEVYAAEHMALGKPVVVKILHRQLADQPGLSDRVRLEAQVLARLTNPHLVDVIDLGRAHDGRPSPERSVCARAHALRSAHRSPCVRGDERWQHAGHAAGHHHRAGELAVPFARGSGCLLAE